MLTQEQRDYIRTLEQVKDDEEIIREIGSSDEELRWYLRRHPRKYMQTFWLIGLLPERTGDFWMSCVPAVNIDAVLRWREVSDRAMWRHRNKISSQDWASYLALGCSEWLLKRMKGTEYLHVSAIKFSKPLSEKFMRQNQDWIDWDDVALYQPMGREFLKEFESRLDYDFLCQNPWLSSRMLGELCFEHGGAFGKRAWRRRNAR